MRHLLARTLAASGAVAGPAAAADLSVTLEIPRLAVAEYHRPYVAVWLENKAQKKLTSLAVWYDLKLRDGEGTKWLKDMRQWWRSTGRELSMPVDGITGATRAPGSHTLSFGSTSGPLAGLPPGRYELLIEAAREVGGRELVRVPVEWPPASPSEAKAAGEHELGPVTVTLKP